MIPMFSCDRRKKRTLKISRETRQRGPPEGLLWSGSYGLCAKCNQFFKNLGAPAPPRKPNFTPLRGAATRLGNLGKKNNYSYINFNLLIYHIFYKAIILCYLLNVPMLLWVWREKVKPLSRAPAEGRGRVDPARNMIGIIWATRKR